MEEDCFYDWKPCRTPYRGSVLKVKITKRIEYLQRIDYNSIDMVTRVNKAA